MTTSNRRFSIVCADKKAEIYLYDVIGEGFFGGISSKGFAEELGRHKSVTSIDLRINSPGGSVFEGFAIYSLLKSHAAKVNVYVDGMAASIASVIAMAGDSIEMASNAYMMIHDPWTYVGGGAADLRKEADLLDQLRDSIANTYAERTTTEWDELVAMMAEETWMSAEQAVASGFADKVSDQKAIAACVDPSFLKFRNVPRALLTDKPEEPEKPTLEQVLASIEERKRQYREAS